MNRMNHTTNILSKIALGFLLFISLNSFSQQQNYTLQCTLGHREIMQNQSFSEDAPEAEVARDVIQDLMNTIDAFYLAANAGESQAAIAKRLEINVLIETANNLNLNISMFNQDIEAIQLYTN